LEIIPRGKGFPKTKMFKGQYEVKLEFPEGWGFKPPSMGEISMIIFWNNTSRDRHLKE